MTRIALIHALAHSLDPINEELKRAWPECQRMNLLDDSLSADLAASGNGLDAAMTERFIKLADYAVATGADAILFTCSAFGSCIEAVARRHANLPVLKPNEAMIADAVATGQAIGLIASFGPTLASMPPEFPASTKVRPYLVESALVALNRGDTETHDRLVVAAAQHLVDEGYPVIALAQFSLARTQEAVARQTGAQVLTTVQSAVRALRSRLAQTT